MSKAARYGLQCVSGRISSPRVYGAILMCALIANMSGFWCVRGLWGLLSEGLSLVKDADSMLENWAELAQ